MGRPLEGLSILLHSWSGDQRSRDRCFRRIWEEYYPRLVVFVRGCGEATSGDAEDLVQEVMEKVYRGIGTYNPAWSFSTWIYTIARNTCRDRARRERRAPVVRSLTDLPASREPFHLRTPEQELIRKEEDRRVEAFFEGVEPETRQIAFLRFHQGMRCAEIAAGSLVLLAMDLPRETPLRQAIATIARERTYERFLPSEDSVKALIHKSFDRRGSK